MNSNSFNINKKLYYNFNYFKIIQKLYNYNFLAIIIIVEDDYRRCDE